MRDTTQGSIPRNFIQKRPSSIGRNTILLPRSLGRKQCLVVMEKSEKRRLTCPTLKKEGLGVGGGDRGKVLRALGEDGHRRRRRIWRACFGRILELLFELHIPDYQSSIVNRNPISNRDRTPNRNRHWNRKRISKLNFESKSKYHSKPAFARFGIFPNERLNLG